MKRGYLSRLPIFWQTMLLMLSTLVVSVLANVLVTMSLPGRRANSDAMHDLAAELSHPETRIGNAEQENTFTVTTMRGPPTTAGEPAWGNVRSDPRLTEMFANYAGVPVARIRLFYAARQTNWPNTTGSAMGGVPMRSGEPLFYNSALAGIQLPDGRWRVLRTPYRSPISIWQQRAMVAFLLAFLVGLPFAYFFARRLSQPIRRFAEAAERVGHDINAPAVPERGSTELRLAARALTSTQSKLRETLAERTAMIGAIAHDLRTPLSRIAFRVEGMPAKVRQAVNADIEQMRAMIATTISFVTRGTELSERRRFDLMPILERLTEDSQAMQFDVTLSGGSGWIEGDSVAIERLIQNVLDNALHYAGSAHLRLERGAGRVVLAIEDNGPGIRESMLETVFKPFKRGEPSRNRATGGVGLGLAIARSIALAHGGGLVAANRETGGLRVTADFPEAPAEAGARSRRARQPSRPFDPGSAGFSGAVAGAAGE